MIILSLFDGISCAQLALNRANLKIEKYYSVENDKFCIEVTQRHFPDTIQLGDIENFYNVWNPEEKVDLLIGGSPCQSLSIASRQKESGLEKGKSILFWHFADIFNTLKPKFFIFENVASMKKSDRDIISGVFNTKPVLINSSLVSAQNRRRLYWTNIPILNQPEDREIYLKDILEKGFTERLKSYCMLSTYYKACAQDYLFKSNRQMIFKKPVRLFHINSGGQGQRVYSIDGKSICLSANGGGQGAKTGLYQISDYVRKLTPIECERLQTIPDNYTEGFSDTQRYKMIGNAFTVDVIVHILNGLKYTKKI